MGLIEAVRRALFNLTDKYISVDDGSLDELSGQLGIFTSARLLGFDGSKWQRLRCLDKYLVTTKGVVKAPDKVEGSTTYTSDVAVITIADAWKYRAITIRYHNKPTSSDNMIVRVKYTSPNSDVLFTMKVITGIATNTWGDILIKPGTDDDVPDTLYITVASENGGNVNYLLDYIALRW